MAGTEGPFTLDDFTAMPQRYSTPLFDFACGFLRDRDAARDLVQNTFCDAWRAVAQRAPPFDQGGDRVDLRRWLYRIAYRRAVDVLRCRRVILWESLEADDGWLVGFGSGAKAPPYQGVVLRYHQGTWSVQHSISNFQFTGVSVDSLTDGWATGFKQYADSTGVVHSQYTLVHYANGTWSLSNAVSAQPDTESFTQVQMLSPTNGWLSKVTTARGGVATTLLYQFDGTQWTLQHTFTTVPNGDNWVPGAFTFLGQTGWYVGAYTIPGSRSVITPSEKLAIYQYHNGQWTPILPEG